MMQDVENLTLYKLITLKAYFCLKFRPKDNKKGCIKKCKRSRYKVIWFKVQGSGFYINLFILAT